MFLFSKPRYLHKWLDEATHVSGPAYQFDVSEQEEVDTENGLTFVMEADVPLTVAKIEEVVREEQERWRAFLEQFLRSAGSYFSRPYTVQHLERIIKHREVTSASTEDVSLPRCIRCVPRMLHFSGGKLQIYWVSYESPVGIDLPEEETIPTIPPVSTMPKEQRHDLEEWDADSLPEEKDATDTQASLVDPTMLLEKQRVREARLKAKLAVYRAQYEMNRFYDRYGNEVSDSDSEQEEEDEEEEEEEPALFL